MINAVPAASARWTVVVLAAVGVALSVPASKAGARDANRFGPASAAVVAVRQQLGTVEGVARSRRAGRKWSPFRPAFGAAETCAGAQPTIVGTENGETLTGTAGDDVIAGLGGDDTIDGLGGNDLICGDAGSDSLVGGGGDDVLDGGADNDVLVGASGNDTLRGGDGALDAVSFYTAPGPGGVVADLSRGTAVGDGVDSLVGVEALSGSAFDDVLTGDATLNALFGVAGNDLLDGRGGFDFVGFIAPTGPAGVVASLASGRASGEGDDRLVLVEGLVGSRGNDTLAGDRRTNILVGQDGNDRLVGGGGDDLLFANAGDDTLNGGNGSDTLEGGAGSDRIDGGAGGALDTASYEDAAGAIRVDLGTGRAAGAAGADVLQRVERAVGSPHDDTLIGDKRANALNGADGSDLLIGRGGNDVLSGGTGEHDRLIGGTGRDVCANGALRAGCEPITRPPRPRHRRAKPPRLHALRGEQLASGGAVASPGGPAWRPAQRSRSADLPSYTAGSYGRDTALQVRVQCIDSSPLYRRGGPYQLWLQTPTVAPGPAYYDNQLGQWRYYVDQTVEWQYIIQWFNFGKNTWVERYRSDWYWTRAGPTPGGGDVWTNERSGVSYVNVMHPAFLAPGYAWRTWYYVRWLNPNGSVQGWHIWLPAQEEHRAPGGNGADLYEWHNTFSYCTTYPKWQYEE